MTEPNDIREARSTFRWVMLKFLIAGLVFVVIAWALRSGQQLDWDMTVVVWLMRAAGSAIAAGAAVTLAWSWARCGRLLSRLSRPLRIRADGQKSSST